MSRLDSLISDMDYICESLKLLKIIQDSGNCNTCGNKFCRVMPKLGEMVRYNCPFYHDIWEDKSTKNENTKN